MSSDAPPAPDCLLVGYGELGVKSKAVRTRMANQLAANVRTALVAAGRDATVQHRWSRVVATLTDPPTDSAERREAYSDAARIASDVVGVVHVRPVVETAGTEDAIAETARQLAADHDADESYAARASRAGPADAHPFTSHELERRVGDAVGEATGAPVDLEDPDRTYRVEVREDGPAFVAVERVEGPGGLPLGTQGTAVALLSGGIDSPVAAWEITTRGVVAVPLYLDLGGYGGVDHRSRAIEAARTLSGYAPGYDTDLRVVDFGAVVDTLVSEVDRTRMLSLRRAMLVAADEVAGDVGAHSLVTGESVGQKSSQTGENLTTTDPVVERPVHRPLLTADKSDITERAKELGTFSSATVDVGCNRVAPDPPATGASLGEVLEHEPDDLLVMARETASDPEVVEFEV